MSEDANDEWSSAVVVVRTRRRFCWLKWMEPSEISGKSERPFSLSVSGGESDWINPLNLTVVRAWDS